MEKTYLETAKEWFKHAEQQLPHQDDSWLDVQLAIAAALIATAEELRHKRLYPDD